MPKIFQTLDKIKPAYDVAYKFVLFVCKLLLTADIVITSVCVVGRYVSFVPDPAWSEEVVLTLMSSTWQCSRRHLQSAEMHISV